MVLAENIHTEMASTAIIGFEGTEQIALLYERQPSAHIVQHLAKVSHAHPGSGFCKAFHYPIITMENPMLLR
jgi:hypothetical protein